MNRVKIKQHETDLDNNYAGVLAVRKSLNSLLFRPIIPFTKSDLSRLYICIKSILKIKIETNDKLSDNEKEQKCQEIDLLMEEAERYDTAQMTSDPYYPHIMTDIERILFIVKAHEITTRLQKIL